MKSIDDITIEDYIAISKVKFNFSDRQRLLGYINANYQTNHKKRIIQKLLQYSEMYSGENLDEYAKLKFNVKEWNLKKIFHNYGIDINGDSVSFKIDQTKLKTVDSSQYQDRHIITSDNLILKYLGYTPHFVLEPLVFQTGNNIIGAERGSGKTRFCISLGYCLVYNVNNFLGYPVNSFGNVLYMNFEIPENQFKLFIEPIENHYKQRYKKKHEFYILNYLSDPDKCLEFVEDYIGNIKPVLVIIDSFKRFVTDICLKENVNVIDNQTVIQVFNILTKWKKKYDTTFLITNHTNKGTKSQKSHSDLMYGPSSLMDYADHTFLIRKTNNPDQRLIIPDKHRFIQEGVYGSNLFEIANNEDGTINFQLIEEDVNESDHMYKEDHKKNYDENIKERAIDLFREGKSCREIANEIDVHFSTISRWIKKYKE